MADELSAPARCREIIMVAVDNSRDRYLELCGRHHDADTTTNTAYENYTALLLTELKPYIDRTCRTLPTRPNGSDGLLNGWHQRLMLAVGTFPTFLGRGSLSGAFQVEHTNF